MKFLLFSDLHCWPGVFMAGCLEDLEVFRKAAVASGCDFVIHCGDFCHDVKQSADVIDAYASFPLPVYHCLGNHDCEETSYEEAMAAYGMKKNYYFFDRGGYRIIVLDPNYFYLDGQTVHYSGKERPKGGWVKDHLPREQIEWLRKTLADSPYPAVLISHQSIEREIGGIANREEILEVIREANRRKRGSVLMCLNGHNHRDHLRILEDVLYVDVNSASYDWVGTEHHLFPRELEEQYSHLCHSVVFEDPLYAIVTLEGSTVTLEGTESRMFMGVRRDQIPGEASVDEMGRPCVPKISSVRITLG
ncbi:MAG: metallophosphoesterase [Clostridia bacterium]|nr:metallophosphoesterase [Clostridia bacterium]